MKVQVFHNKRDFALTASKEVNKIDPNYPLLNVVLQILGDLSPGLSITLYDKIKKNWSAFIFLDPSEKAYYSRYIHELSHVAIFRLFWFLPDKIKIFLHNFLDLLSWTYTII